MQINSSHVPQNDHVFKKPQNSWKRATRKKPKIKPLPLVSTQIYKPSPNVKAFDNSKLLRASKKLIISASVKNKRPKTKNLIEKQSEFKQRKTLRHNSRSHHINTSFENANNFPMEPIQRMETISNAAFESPNGPDGELKQAFDPPIFLEENSSDHFQIRTFEENALDVQLHTRKRATNFDMIRTINESFMGFLANDVNEMNSMSNLFENAQQSVSNLPSGLSIYNERSELLHRHHRNDSTHTHYQHHTTPTSSRYSSFNSNNSAKINRNQMSCGGSTKSHRTSSIKNSSRSVATEVVPIKRPDSSHGRLSEELRQTGWPVTININFGRPK